MRVTIVSGGFKPSRFLLKDQIKKSDVVICADSGANCFFEYKLTPNYLLGDFDSIEKNILDFFKNEKCIVEKFPPEKDFTDTELALSKAIELGAKEIVFLGCTGSRMDHFFGNLALLYKCMKNSIKASIKDDNNKIFLTCKNVSLSGNYGEYFSVMPFSEMVGNLSILGAKYELVDYDLKKGDALTVSNEFIDNTVTISFSSGILIVFYSQD
ncbi:thiamine diphosphokinase [Clostridium sediminicola]|uniref:thiamine diphosphokinase n=1 Tax=Clostridium sediminicola TaxID=3114879 RepID=UPI0031F24335